MRLKIILFFTISLNFEIVKLLFLFSYQIGEIMVGIARSSHFNIFIFIINLNNNKILNTQMEKKNKE